MQGIDHTGRNQDSFFGRFARPGDSMFCNRIYFAVCKGSRLTALDAVFCTAFCCKMACKQPVSHLESCILMVR